MTAKRKNVTEAEVDTEERENLMRDVTAEITERLLAEEENNLCQRSSVAVAATRTGE